MGPRENKIHKSILTGKSPNRYSENKLTPVALSGVVVPRTKVFGDRKDPDFKFVSASGFEYSIVADNEWSHLLSIYSWEEVKIVGLLNLTNMTLIPQRVFPKGPTGDRENLTEFAAWKGRNLAKKLVEKINDLVVVPAAALAAVA